MEANHTVGRQELGEQRHVDHSESMNVIITIEPIVDDHRRFGPEGEQSLAGRDIEIELEITHRLVREVGTNGNRINNVHWSFTFDEIKGEVNREYLGAEVAVVLEAEGNGRGS